ncbi:DNA-binding transcriptional LysR family regulator [Rhizobium subbaraonis]|uniref:DNA-binding transcriptional LysR family regulator n=1 Tax=Rhizobium subbaraonis TaxID=908946 RepID=A0A285UEX3_9HYPH|nr:LysR family transcriptional regulator [Rhizobium subbaraonis]SOC40372.1 DNA-binding transcriptional LysR family regulator [Rhizobium subbaraonis]
MDLATLCLVETILRTGSVRAAARLEGRPASSASAALRRLEAAISIPLVRREGPVLVPTLEAQARVERLAEMARAARELLRIAPAGNGYPPAARAGTCSWPEAAPPPPHRSAPPMPQIPLESLARFCATVYAGSIRSAARTLKLGQPQLTRQLVRLEQAVGLPLLHRSPGGVACTPEGVAALAIAERIGSIWAGLSQASDERFRKTAHTWRLGSVIPFGHESDIARMLAGLAAEWRRQRPRQPLFIASTTADELIFGLQSRRFDLALLDIDRYPAEFEGALVSRQPLALAVPRSLALGRKGTQEDATELLQKHPIAMPSVRSGLRQMTDRYIANTLSASERARLTLVEVDSIPVIINLVREHGHLSILPEQSVSRIADSPALIRLDARFQQSLSLVWPRNAVSRQTAAAVLEIISAPANEYSTPSTGGGAAT